MNTNNKLELLEIINEFTVNNIESSISFYSKYFEFNVIETTGNPATWAKLQKDNCIIMLESYNEVCKEITNYPKKVINSNLIKFKYINKDKVINLYNKFINDNIKLLFNLKETDYGSIEFGVYDPDDNMIILSSNK